MRYAWIEANRDGFEITRMCRVLEVSRSGFDQWRKRAPSARAQANVLLDGRVRSIHSASAATYGRDRILRDLHTQGLRVGHERVRKSLNRQHLRCVYKRPFRVTTDSQHDQPPAPNVLKRRFGGWAPNQAWVADVTYVTSAQGWLYLACVIDLASRKVIGWAMSDRLHAQLVCEALKMAYWHRKPPAGLIVHTDRGVQYVSAPYKALIRDFKMIASMSRRANCWDNAVVESFFKTLKVERVDRRRYATRTEARVDIVAWIEGFYNRVRLHSSIGYRTPVAMELALHAA